jgi:transposase
LEWLISQEIPCREENALKISKSLGLRRGKDDQIDVKDICQFAFEKRDTIQPSNLPKPLIVNLKKLLSRRDFLVRHKQSLDVTLNDQDSALEPDLFSILKSRNNALIEEYKNQIKEIEEMIDKLMEEDEQMKTNYALAKSVVGIGKITAAYLIALTENFTSFSNGRKFACYGGVAPFPNRSGTRIGKTKVSQMANKKIKSLLSNGVNAAVMYDNEIHIYYKRKLAEGKEKGVVLNAIKNKLIHRVFAVINRQTPYVKIMNYA